MATERLPKPVLQHLQRLVQTDADPPSPARPTEKGIRKLGRYRLMSELGRGSGGVVYRALDTQLRREVAIKVFAAFPTDDAEARFVRGAVTAARLRHPGIVSTFDIGEVDGESYISMELIEGQTLADAAPTLSRTRLLEVVRDVALALQYAHDQGVVHRDVKPSNIILSKDGKPFVLDFGLARSLNPASRVTETGAILGTLMYISPEQTRGHVGDVDTRTDIYSLGAVLYEGITRHPPVAPGGVFEMVKEVQDGAPVRPRSIDPSIPRDLELVMLKALEKEKSLRYQRAGDLAVDIEAILRGEPVGARYGRLRRWIRPRRKALLTGAGLVLLAAIAVPLAAKWRASAAPPPSPPVVVHAPPRDVAADVARAEELVKKAISDLSARQPASAKPRLEEAERLLLGAIDDHSADKGVRLTLARVQGLLGKHAEALAALEPLIASQALTQDFLLGEESQERLMLFAAETLPADGPFDLSRIARQPGFEAWYKRLQAYRPPPGSPKLGSRFELASQTLASALKGDRAGARTLAQKLMDIEGQSEAKGRIGICLAALLADTREQLPGGAQRWDYQPTRILALGSVAVEVAGGHFVFARKLLNDLFDSTPTPPASALYLWTVCEYVCGGTTDAIEWLGRCPESSEPAYAVPYLHGLLALLTDASEATRLLEEASRVEGAPAAVLYHLAASRASLALAGGQDRDALLARAMADLEAAVVRARAVGAWRSSGVEKDWRAWRTLPRFYLSPDVLRSDRLLAPLREPPAFRERFEALMGE